MCPALNSRRRPASGPPPPTPRDGEALVEPTEHERRLLVLLRIVEHVNASAAAMSFAAHASSGSQPIFLTQVIDRTRHRLARARPAWARSSVLEALDAAGLDPAPDVALIESQCNWLAGVVRRGRERPHRLAQRALPEVRRWRVPIRGLADVKAEDRTAAEVESPPAPRRTAMLVDEALDPIAVLLDYLGSELKVEATRLDHDLQQFIRTCFGLSYRRHYVLLANLCAQLNKLYYGLASLSVQAAHDVRPPVVLASDLLSIIRYELRRTFEPLDPELRAKLIDGEEACALGFYFTLRFCKLVRIQFHPAAAGLESVQAPEVDASLERDARVHGVVSPLQPLEYSMLRCRIFGLLAGIEGFDEIFGGGLLPGVDLGRVWVLGGAAGGGKTSLAVHLSTDYAARHQLVVYFSFEESYRNIGDRAVMFRLYRRQLFQVAAVADDLEERIAGGYADEDRRGLLLYYRESKYDLSRALAVIRDVLERRAPDWVRSTLIVLDSIDALEQGSTPEAEADSESESRFGRRALLRQLFRQLEESRFWTIVITEGKNPELPTLQHLADTFVEVGVDESRTGRWLQIHKCRLQDFMPGRHAYQLRDGEGVTLVPNVAAVQRVVRRRVPATLSESVVVPLPDALWSALPVTFLQQKSSTLIWGDRRSGKTTFWLNLLTEPSRRVPQAERNQLADIERVRAALPFWPRDPMGAFLVVSFRTSPPRFRQGLRSRHFLQTRWNLCPVDQLRWYQPGPELTPAHVFRDIRRAITQARIAGTPIERIVFDDIDAIEPMLPGLAADPAFWPTMFGLLASEAMTVIYVLASESDKEPTFSEKFAAGIDYAFHFWRPPASETALAVDSSYLHLYKHPGPPSQLSDRPITISVSAHGTIGLQDDASS